jgi:hypothetical protein
MSGTAVKKEPEGEKMTTRSVKKESEISDVKHKITVESRDRIQTRKREWDPSRYKFYLNKYFILL